MGPDGLGLLMLLMRKRERERERDGDKKVVNPNKRTYPRSKPMERAYLSEIFFY
jgi:hypothetical protein